jgi:hypothetical protein
MSFEKIVNFISNQDDNFPPVHLWDPALCEGSKFNIDQNGQWHFNNSPIKREKFQILFSRILKKEGDSYFLVSPVEKISVDCAIAPYKIIDFEIDSSHNILFKTNLNYSFRPDSNFSSRLISNESETIPVIEIRNGIEGFFDRNVYYRLADLISSYGKSNGDTLELRFANFHFKLGFCT